MLVQGLAGDRLALGYFGYAYYVENQDKLKLIPIINPKTGEAVLPSLESINKGTYQPLSRVDQTLNVIYLPDELEEMMNDRIIKCSCGEHN